MMLVSFGLAIKSNAQKKLNGLYLTYNDYLDHKLTYATGPDSAKADKINLHGFLEGARVTVISNGKKQFFAKNEIYGYRDNNGTDYRFFDKKACRVIDTNGFCIYSINALAQQGKGFKSVKAYYFSKKANGEMLPLTDENIAAAFPGNNLFQLMASNELKQGFDNNSDYHVSKIKELYLSSLKK